VIDRYIMTVSVILVPIHEYQDLETHIVSWDDPPPPALPPGRDRVGHTQADRFKLDISRILGVAVDEQQHDDYLEIPLLRPRSGGDDDDDVPGLYAYSNAVPHEERGGVQNVRATRLAMACGLLSLRFYGPVLLVRSSGASRWADLSASEIRGAACVSPDLRPSIQRRCLAVASSATAAGMVVPGADGGDPPTGTGIGADAAAAAAGAVPGWLADAAMRNYRDGAELRKVISAMNPAAGGAAGGGGNRSDIDSDGCDDDETADDAMDPPEGACAPPPRADVTTTEFVTKTPLCIHCRRSSSELCESCEGVYFCSSDANTTTAAAGGGRNRCKNDGWSHACLCPTWRIYSGPNRRELSRFDDGFFGEWQDALTSRPHQLGEGPYEEFLRSFYLGIEAERSSSSGCASWWRTEFGGWSGGKGYSASKVDATIRQSYSQGFAPIVDFPPERRITQDDIERSGMQSKRNAVGLLALSSWKEYYTVRNISPTSPVCLLCTFPLTIYRAIEQYGDVPVTVARMLNRPLRIHVVGAEKEMNFLDLFKELTFLLPEDMQVRV